MNRARANVPVNRSLLHGLLLALILLSVWYTIALPPSKLASRLAAHNRCLHLTLSVWLAYLNKCSSPIGRCSVLLVVMLRFSNWVSVLHKALLVALLVKPHLQPQLLSLQPRS